MARTDRRNPALTELGNRVRAERERQNLSQMALAERVGLHFSFVSETERGIRNISMSSLLRIAEGLNVNPAVLVDNLVWDD